MNIRFKNIVKQIANDDTIKADYLKVGWRDILLHEVKK